MLRHVVKILRSDWAGWCPSMAVVGVVTVLVTACCNQFNWTTSPDFLAAARRAGLDGAEFAIVSVTIYTVVALLAVCSLMVVGSATVERTRSTFAQWRLMGATPRQVRACLWALVALASLIGAVPGALIGSALSTFAVPWFNQLAAGSFAAGVGDFVAPTFRPSAIACALALLVSVLTCLLGAWWPARRAASVEPVEIMRGPSLASRRRSWPRWIGGSLLILIAVAMAVAAPQTLDATQVGVSAMVMVNAATWVGAMSAAGMYLLGPGLVRQTLNVVHWLLSLMKLPVGQLAVRAAQAQAAMNANMIAPLAAAIGLGGVVFTATGSYLKVMAAAGFPLDDPNWADIVVLTGLFCVMAIVTSVAVIVLSAGEQAREHAILRCCGMSPKQISGLVGWQSFCLALCVFATGMVPVLLVIGLVVGCSLTLVGSVALSVPWSALTVAFVVCWAVLWAVQFSQAAPRLRQQMATILRQA